MNKEFIQAIEDLEKERQISKDVLIEAIESIQTTNGLAVLAYPKNFIGDDIELLKEIIGSGIDGIEI